MADFTQHDRDVAVICEQVKKFHADKKHFRIFHGSTGTTRPINFQPGSYIDTSKLTRTFPVDKTKQTIQVEPKIGMDELVKATMKYGFLPKVTLELMGLTVGGAYSGTAGESNSYKYSMFEKTICEIEIILGDGTLTTASRDFQPDLLEWAGSSMGTMGVVTLLEVELLPAKKYVRLDIKRVNGMTDALTHMDAACKNPAVEFIDGILFTKDFGIVMTGALTDDSQGLAIRSFTKRSEPWFTNYVEDVAHNKKQDPPESFVLPVTDYLFRYDRGVFWGAKLAFDYFHVPFISAFRWLLDPLMGSRVAYHALHEGGFASKYVVQDCSMPRSKAAAFVDYIASILPNYYFFLCPVQTGTEMQMMNKIRSPAGSAENRQLIADERIYNVGVYGKGPTDYDEFITVNRQIESKLWNEFCGLKMLYARSYYTEEEFLDMYAREPYEEIRKKYKAEDLPNMYEKISADMNSGRRPPKLFAGCIGAGRAALGLWNKKRATGYLIAKAKKEQKVANATNGATKA